MYVWYKNLKNLLGQGIFVVQFFSLVEFPLQLPPWVSFCIFTRTWCLTPVSTPCPHDFEHEDSSFQSPHTQSSEHFKNIFVLWKCKLCAGNRKNIVYPSITFVLLLLTWTINISRAWGQSCELVVTLSLVFLYPKFSPNLRFDATIITIWCSTCFGAFRVINPAGPCAVSCLGKNVFF